MGGTMIAYYDNMQCLINPLAPSIEISDILDSSGCFLKSYKTFNALTSQMDRNYEVVDEFII